MRTRDASAAILGVGAYRPHRIVDNDTVGASTGRTAEWIQRRTGIQTRRYATAGETVADMAVEAARKAVADAGLAASDLHAVVVASMSNLRQSPGVAPEVAHRLGGHAAAFDVNAACAGFCSALALAASLVRDGSAGHVLVVGSDKMTDIVDPHDPTAGFLFADGAGAMVISSCDDDGVGPVVWGSDGGRAELIGHTATWLEYRDDPACAWPTMRMSGQEVFRWAIDAVPGIARAALNAAGIAVDDLDAFIPHQANLRIIDAIAQRLDLPPKVTVARDVVTSGNTSAASIPLATARLHELGVVARGGLALLVGFGAGLTWAAQVVRLP